MPADLNDLPDAETMRRIKLRADAFPEDPPYVPNLLALIDALREALRKST